MIFFRLLCKISTLHGRLCFAAACRRAKENTGKRVREKGRLMKKSVSIPLRLLQREPQALNHILRRFGAVVPPEEEPAFYTLRLRWTQYLLELIVLGDSARVERFLAETLPEELIFETEKLSENEEQLARYLVVSAVALFAHTAICAGLPAASAFALQNGVIRQVDSLAGPEQIYPLIFEALRAYCGAVHAHRISACSHPVRMCCEYIEENIYAPLRVSALGDVCGLSAKYLAERFQKELGVSPKAYILRRKLEHARFRLMEYREQPIAEIAFLYSFPDHSHFSARFRRHFGVTPQEMRWRARTGEAAPAPWGY